MMLNRRALLFSTPALVGVRPMMSIAAQATVTSGGIGLTLADVRSMYEELPEGQSFRNFAEPQSRTTLYIDFGDDDFARNIWVSGELDEEGALALITWLCPDDIEPTHVYQILTGAGSIAFENLMTFDSAFLAGFDSAWKNFLAKLFVVPGEFGVKSLMLTVEQAVGVQG